MSDTTVKTTVLLRDEVYDYLLKKYGRRRMSEAVNEALLKDMFKPAKSMFGIDPKLTTKNIRDEEEPHENA